MTISTLQTQWLLDCTAAGLIPTNLTSRDGVGAPPVVSALEGTSLGEQGAGHCLASRAAVTVCLRRLKQQRCTLAVMEVGSLRSGCPHGWSLVNLLFLACRQPLSLCAHMAFPWLLCMKREKTLFASFRRSPVLGLPWLVQWLRLRIWPLVGELRSGMLCLVAKKCIHTCVQKIKDQQSYQIRTPSLWSHVTLVSS